MTAAIVLPANTRIVPDARDHGRLLRVRWHPADDQFVLSIWRENTCAATFQLVRADAPGLIASLAEGLAAAPAAWSNTTTVATDGIVARVRRRVSQVRSRSLGLRR